MPDDGLLPADDVATTQVGPRLRVRDAATGAALELPVDVAHSRLADGTALAEGDGSVAVVAPDGRAGTVPGTRLADAVRAGYRVETPLQRSTRLGNADAAADAERAVGDTLGGGALEEAAAALAGGTGLASGRGATGGVLGYVARNFFDATHQATGLGLSGDEFVDRLDALARRNPGATLGGDVAGTAGALLLPGAGLGAAGRVARGLSAPVRASEALGLLAERGVTRALGAGGTSMLGRMATRTLGGAVQGAVSGAADGVVRELTDHALHNGRPDEYGERIIAGAREGALWGGGVGGLFGFGGGALREGARLVSRGGDVLRRAWRGNVGTELDEGVAELAAYTLGDALGDLGPRGQEARRVILHGDAVLDDGARDVAAALQEAEQAGAHARDYWGIGPKRDQVRRYVRGDLGQALNMGRAGDRAISDAIGAAERVRAVGEELAQPGVYGGGAVARGRRLIQAAEARIEELRRVARAATPAPDTVVDDIAQLRTLPGGAVDEAATAVQLPRRDLTPVGVGRRITADQVADAFVAVDSLKREVGRVISSLERVDSEAHQVAVRLYDEGLRPLLENEGLWGRRAAGMQREVNRAYSAFLTNRDAFARRFLSDAVGAREGFREVRAVDPARIRGFLQRAGTAANDLDAKVFREVVEAQEALNEAIRRNMDVSGDVAREIAGSRAAADKAKRALAAAEGRARILNQYRALVQDAANSGQGFAGRMAARMAGGMAGYALGGLPGVIVGSGLGGAVMAAVQPAERLRALAMIDSLSSKVDGRIRNSVATFVRRGAGGVRRVGRAARGAAQRAGHLADEEAFNERIEQVQRFRADPDAVRQQLSDATRELDDHAPTVRDAVHTSAIRGLQHLSEHVPMPIGANGAMLPGITRRLRYLEQDRVRFMRRARVVDNPMTVLDDLEDGRLNLESVDALREVYPSLHQAIVQELMTVIAAEADRAAGMSYASKTQISLLTGQPTDPTLTPDFIRAFQRTFQLGGAAPQSRQSSGPNLSISRNLATSTQASEARRAAT